MDRTDPRFSVIIPTRNYGRFLPRAVDSVLAQQGADFEVRVIDDGSTDDTAAVAAGYGDRIAYHHQPPAGPYRACQRGVEQTPPGRYIVFLDADDRLRPGFLRAMAGALCRSPEAGMLFGTVINVSADGREKPSPTPAVGSDPMTNFDRFIRGSLELSAGGAVFARSVVDPLAAVLDRCGSFHGLDRVLIAQGLASGACRIVPEAVLEIHDHPHRLRDDADSFCTTGLRAVEALFHPAVLPEAAMPYRRLFLSRLLLEQGRLLYRRGRYREAASRYRRAMLNRPTAALHGRHLRRMLITTFRAGLPDRRRLPAPQPVTPPQPVEEKLHGDG